MCRQVAVMNHRQLRKAKRSCVCYTINTVKPKYILHKNKIIHIIMSCMQLQTSSTSSSINPTRALYVLFNNGDRRFEIGICAEVGDDDSIHLRSSAGMLS